MRISRGLTLVFISLMASACNGSGGDPSNPATSSTKGTDSAVRLSFDPAALSSCDTSTLVKVRWDARSTEKVRYVNVFTVRPEGKEAMFARHARLSGVKRTGHWIRAGREFVLRDDRGVELARASVGTLPCASPDSQVP